MSNPAGSAEATGGFAAQLDALRSAAKWLVAAFAGVAVLLVGGLQLSGIGQLPTSSWRLYVAVAAAGLALATVGYMIKEASVVLTHDWLTLASFGDEPGGPVLRPQQQSAKRSLQFHEIDDRLSLSRHELFGYAAPTVQQLHARLRRADELIWQAEAGSEQAAEAARQAATLRQAARDAVQYANYYFTLKLFQDMRIRLGWAAAVAAISIGVFAYAANPPKNTSPVPVKIVSLSESLRYGNPRQTGPILITR